MKYLFFYDESEHSRRLTEKTLLANDFEKNFCVAIIGYPQECKKDFETDYYIFEK